MKIIIKDKTHLKAGAKEFLKLTSGKKIFAFYGSMGAGKTTIIKSICEALGAQDIVTSPTFTIVNEYRTLSLESIYHIDFYRIKKTDEVFDFGIEELRDTLNVPHIRGNMVDHKLLNAKITIVKMLDARVHGAAVQRTLNYTKTEVGVVGNLSNAERERLIEVQIKNLENHERTTARVLETSSKAILPDGVDGI